MTTCTAARVDARSPGALPMVGRLVAVCVAAALFVPAIAAAQTTMPMPQPVPVGPPIGPPAPPQGPSGMFGLDLGLLGPASLFSVSGVVRPRKNVEAIVGLGLNSAEQSQNEGSVSATAAASINTFLVRGRYLPMGRHSLLLEAGLGVSATTLNATGTDTSGNSLTYSRAGMIPIAVGGVGYALRAYGGFRLSVLAGWREALAGMDDSTVSFTGQFDEDDKIKAKKDLDEITDGLAQSSVYLELSVGWAF